ncbi:MAG: glycosyltransferase family 2 protein [Cytophagales bacterium]|nr:glycosyltransferase family 2 protein [Cytophagales bacterium]
MEQRPEVSIIIPVYNSTNELKRALASVSIQSYQNYEVIVVDDGSEIETLPLLEQLQTKNLKYYYIPHKNANVARNYGIARAKGSYIAMLDSDDEWLPGHLEDNLRIMNERNCDGIYGSVIFKSKEETFKTVARPLKQGETMIDYLLSTQLGAQTSTLFMKKDRAVRINWDESLNRHQDYDFVLRFSIKFRWYIKEEASTIYNYDGPGKRIDFESCIRFIRFHEQDISWDIYQLYHRRMLYSALKANAPMHIVAHYIKNSRKRPHISFQERIRKPDHS